jgi:hypothetical protein
MIQTPWRISQRNRIGTEKTSANSDVQAFGEELADRYCNELRNITLDVALHDNRDDKPVLIG